MSLCTNDCNNVIIRIAFLPAADGDIDRRLGRLAAALTREAQKLEPQNAESPSIVLETATSSGERGQIIVRRENDLNVAIEKKQESLKLSTVPSQIHLDFTVAIYHSEHSSSEPKYTILTRTNWER